MIVAKLETNGVFIHEACHAPILNYTTREFDDFVTYIRQGKLSNPEDIELDKEIYEESQFEIIERIPMRSESGSTWNDLIYKFIK